MPVNLRNMLRWSALLCLGLAFLTAWAPSELMQKLGVSANQLFFSLVRVSGTTALLCIFVTQWYLGGNENNNAVALASFLSVIWIASTAALLLYNVVQKGAGLLGITATAIMWALFTGFMYAARTHFDNS